MLHRLVDRGNSVRVIDNNLDVLWTIDWVMDLRPEERVRGGTVVAAGTANAIAAVAERHTGRRLARVP
ncbi:MAG: hypothetical protein ABIP66_02505 [Gemmatimonadaceae bacterium]